MAAHHSDRSLRQRNGKGWPVSGPALSSRDANPLRTNAGVIEVIGITDVVGHYLESHYNPYGGVTSVGRGIYRDRNKVVRPPLRQGNGVAVCSHRSDSLRGEAGAALFGDIHSSDRIELNVVVGAIVLHAEVEGLPAD